jgi:NAD(P)-dependent dehydrogenase (short-subunit alcohol dehydrogenase family)
MQTILITGCSTGFGRITATHFAKLGWKVFGTVRKESDAESLRQEHQNIVPLICDIVNESQVKVMAQTVAAQTSSLDVLVNNAGTAFPAPLEFLPPQELLAQLNLNVVAQVAVLQAVMPLLKKAGGMIINVSSISGRVTAPITGAYSASKFALEALSDALRIELAPFGVKVVVIEPGSSPTAIWETSRQRGFGMLTEQGADISVYQKLLDVALARVSSVDKTGFRPELFAETVWKIANSPKPKARYLVPSKLIWRVWLRKLMPDEWWDAMIRRAVKW